MLGPGEEPTDARRIVRAAQPKAFILRGTRKHPGQLLSATSRIPVFRFSRREMTLFHLPLPPWHPLRTRFFRVRIRDRLYLVSINRVIEQHRHHFMDVDGIRELDSKISKQSLNWNGWNFCNVREKRRLKSCLSLGLAFPSKRIQENIQYIPRILIFFQYIFVHNRLPLILNFNE